MIFENYTFGKWDQKACNIQSQFSVFLPVFTYMRWMDAFPPISKHETLGKGNRTRLRTWRIVCPQKSSATLFEPYNGLYKPSSELLGKSLSTKLVACVTGCNKNYPDLIRPSSISCRKRFAWIRRKKYFSASCLFDMSPPKALVTGRFSLPSRQTSSMFWKGFYSSSSVAFSRKLSKLLRPSFPYIPVTNFLFPLNEN